MRHFVAVPRQIAIARGLRFYQDIEPCRAGHSAPRFARGGLCSICRAEYNRDRYLRNRETILARQRANYAANPEVKLAKNRTWEGNNRVWRKQWSTAWRDANPHVYAAHTARRRLAKAKRVVRWFDEFDELTEIEAAELCVRREAATGLRWAVDHMLPLRAAKVSGLHCALNLQVIPHSLNARKHNKLWFTEPGQWIKKT